ncbi:hypothetical protein AX15_000782 [Amanita polypyramis BW_CC]|nr:hypothetical protein AX15_000782 [Amanita polypyramis BW_CC]
MQSTSVGWLELSPESDANEPQQEAGRDGLPNSMAVFKQMYVMEASCPHLGADLSHAEIEECETGLVAVCPWHRYDFDLRTGKSEMGLRACTYAVKVAQGNATERGDRVDIVYVETPGDGSGWRLVELRPVSEEFANLPAPPPPTPVVVTQNEREPQREPEPVVPQTGTPKTLIQWAVLILNTPDPILKVQRTRHAVHLFRTGKLISIGHKSASAPKPPDIPARDAEFSRNIVDPGKMKSSKRNRAAMLHALANIEQWATLLTSRLAEISPNAPYGSMPVHASLWESASATTHSLRARLAIIHLVHEARGLDVNPGTIERFRRAGDGESVAVMEIIHADEVTHVTAGHRWFTWCCNREGSMDPVKIFREEDREKAGMTREFYENLRGEIKEGEEIRGGKAEVTKLCESAAHMAIRYDQGK